MTEALLRRVRLPKRIWEPCCGDGAMAQVLEANGYHVVGIDLVDRGYGETGRDFLQEIHLPEGVTAIVTNPPYGRRLFEFVDHALELTRPVDGMVAMLVNTQRPTGAANSTRLRHPAYEASVVLTNRIVWFPDDDGQPAASPQENHCWLVWDWSRTPGPARQLFASKDEENRTGSALLHRVQDAASVHRPFRCPAMFGNMSATRQAPRHGPAPHCLTIQVPVNDPLNMRLCLDSSVLLVPTFVIG